MADHTPDGVTGPPRSPRGEPGRVECPILQCWDRHYECTDHGAGLAAFGGWCYDRIRATSWLALGSGELMIHDRCEPLFALRPDEWGIARFCPVCGGAGGLEPGGYRQYGDREPPERCEACHGGGLLSLVKPGTLGPVR